MTNQNLATAVAEAAPVSPIALRIPVDNLSLDIDGMVMRALVLRLPRGVEMRHLIENSGDCFKLIQQSPRSLRKFDKLTVIAFDESWLATTIVASATDTDVALAKPAIVQLQARTAVLPGDDKFQIVWDGAGYVVKRRSDGHTMTLPVASLAVAQNDLSGLYPRKVVG